MNERYIIENISNQIPNFEGVNVQCEGHLIHPGSYKKVFEISAATKQIDTSRYKRGALHYPLIKITEIPKITVTSVTKTDQVIIDHQAHKRRIALENAKKVSQQKNQEQESYAQLALKATNKQIKTLLNDISFLKQKENNLLADREKLSKQVEILKKTIDHLQQPAVCKEKIVPKRIDEETSSKVLPKPKKVRVKKGSKLSVPKKLKKG